MIGLRIPAEHVARFEAYRKRLSARADGLPVTAGKAALALVLRGLDDEQKGRKA